MTHELYEKLLQLQWLLHKQQIRGRSAGGPMADTTRGRGRIIAVLKLRDGISTKDLSYLLGVRISSLNELLAKLEKSGYVTREPAEQDKRVMLVKLTEKGREEQQSEPSDHGGIFSCLSDDEQKTLGEYLDRITDALRADFGDDEEEMLEKMEALRERLGDFGDFFKEHGRDFPGWWGPAHDIRAGGHFGRGGFPRGRGFRNHEHEHDRGHGKNED
ncbi:MAG: MarR family transcriptional regulator [Oscillospiraceae bacterium]|nr:MarR family transcriptional regulator [Oscillospiraceae bacterium]